LIDRNGLQHYFLEMQCAANKSLLKLLKLELLHSIKKTP
jgi:hypothetical protein